MTDPFTPGRISPAQAGPLLIDAAESGDASAAMTNSTHATTVAGRRFWPQPTRTRSRPHGC